MKLTKFLPLIACLGTLVCVSNASAQYLKSAAWGYPVNGGHRVSLKGTEFYLAKGRPSPLILPRVDAKLRRVKSDLQRLDIVAKEACAIDQTYYRTTGPDQRLLDILNGLNGRYNVLQGNPANGGGLLLPGGISPRRIKAAAGAMTEQESNFCQHPSG
jgi:hypothetical protein